MTTTNGAIVTSTNLYRLYRNDSGTFTDTNVKLTYTDGTLGPIRGTAAWGDYDNDGRLDLLLAGQSTLILYCNLGNGAFSNALSSGLTSGSSSSSAAFIISFFAA